MDLAIAPALGIDICCIQVFPDCCTPSESAKNSFLLCGVYFPAELVASEWWRSAPDGDCIICTDVNCHGSWTSFGTPDKCSDEIDVWLVTRNMIVANEHSIQPEYIRRRVAIAPQI